MPKRKGKRNTSQTSVTSSTADESELDNTIMWLMDFKVQWDNRLEAYKSLYEQKVQAVDLAFELILSRLPPETADQNKGDKRNHKDPVVKDEISQSSDVKQIALKTRHRSSSVDSIRHEKVRRVTRSSSLNKLTAFKPPKTASATKQMFKTPAISSLGLSLITPKVKLNAPLSVMRHPRQGEMAVSLSGSPLMMTPLIQDRPNVNVPLSDGRVLSILPEQSLRPYEIPSLDEETKKELLTLREHINAFINMGH